MPAQVVELHSPGLNGLLDLELDELEEILAAASVPAEATGLYTTGYAT